MTHSLEINVHTGYQQMTHSLEMSTQANSENSLYTKSVHTEHQIHSCPAKLVLNLSWLQ